MILTSWRPSRAWTETPCRVAAFTTVPRRWRPRPRTARSPHRIHAWGVWGAISGRPISFENLQQRITRLRSFWGAMSGPPISFESLQQRITRLRRFGGPCRGPPSLLRACNSASRLGPQIAPARLENREHRRPRGLRSQDAPAEADHAPAAGARGVDLAVIEPALGADEHDGAARTLRVRQRGAERRRVAFPT